MRVAVVFPGQGSHRAGSLDPWAQHPSFGLVDRISEAIGRDVLALTRDESAGSRTADAQPAIFAASVVAFDALRSSGVPVDVVAGHSLGEYGAAVASGTVDVDEGAAIVAARGEAMGRACAQHPGTMAAIVKLEPELVEQLVEEIEDLVIANDNAPGQVVVAGPPRAVEAARERARELGGRAVPLDVEGAFHSPAMRPAVDAVRQALAGVRVRDPEIPVVTGLDGTVLTDGSSVTDALVDGILAPVRWRAVQDELADVPITDFVEVGPGGVLAGLAKRAFGDVRIHRVENPADLATVTELLAGAAGDPTRSEVAS